MSTFISLGSIEFSKFVTILGFLPSTYGVLESCMRDTCCVPSFFFGRVCFRRNLRAPPPPHPPTPPPPPPLSQTKKGELHKGASNRKKIDWVRRTRRFGDHWRFSPYLSHIHVIGNFCLCYHCPKTLLFFGYNYIFLPDLTAKKRLFCNFYIIVQKQSNCDYMKKTYPQWIIDEWLHCNF